MARDYDSVLSLSEYRPDSASNESANPPGSLYLVGMGNGDPLQITLAGVKVLQGADDVIVGSGLDASLACQPELQIPANARLWYYEGSSQIEIVAQIVNSGRNVAWLTRGDAIADGRALRPARKLAEYGVRVDIVPGISMFTLSATTTGLATGGPLKLYQLDGDEADQQYSSVIISNTSQIKELAKHLARQNLSKDTPVLISINSGTTNQRSIETTCGKLLKAIPADEVDQPMIAVLGEFQERAAELDWFETKKLFGWQVLVPRTKGVSGVLERRLESYGAQVIQVPTLAVEPPRNLAPLERAIQGLVDGRYQWTIFNSPNAVQAVTGRLSEFGLDARAFSGLRIAAVGHQTVAALRAWGIEPDLVPYEAQSNEALTAEFPFFDDLLDPINRVFIPRAEVAVDSLASALTDLGWEVEDVTAFRTVRAAPPPADVREGIKAGYFDAVVFTSVTSVRNMVGIAGKPHSAMIIAAIGPATAQVCEELGVRVDVLAAKPDIVSLVDGLADFAAERRAQQLAEGLPVKRPSQRRARRRRNTTL